MLPDSRSISEPGSLTSPGPAHPNLYRHWSTGPSINLTDSSSSYYIVQIDNMDFLLSDTDIMTSDGEMVNILLSEINTQSRD